LCAVTVSGVYRVLVGKPEEKRPLGRPRGRWEDNIKIDLQELGCGDMDWIELVQDRDRSWSLTLRKESRLRIFENRVLRRIFGPKRNEVTGEWRKLHNELNLYCSTNIFRVIKSRE
jgi:hypothetical protein